MTGTNKNQVRGKEFYTGLKGHFHLDVISKTDGHIVDSFDEHNMIMTPARQSMSEIFANLIGVKFASKLGLGTMGCQDSSKYLPRDEYTGFEKSRDRMFCEPSRIYSVGEIVPQLLYGDLIAVRAGDSYKFEEPDIVFETDSKITGSWVSKDGEEGLWSVDETGEGTWTSSNGAAGLVSFTVTQQPTPEEPDSEEGVEEGDIVYYQYLGDQTTNYVITDSQLANTARFKVIKDKPYAYYTEFEMPRYNTEEPSTEWNLDKASLDAIGVQQKDSSVVFTFIIDQDSANDQHDNDPMYVNPTSEFNEAAIYVNDRIFCMRTFPTKIKDNSVKFKIVWTITF